MKTFVAFFILYISLTFASKNVSETTRQSFDFRPGGLYNPLVRQGSISAGLFTCSSTNPLVGRVCGVVLGVVDSELRSASLVIRRGSLLVNYNDPTDYSIPTGHSCSITCTRRHTALRAFIGTQNALRISGDVLRKPFVIGLNLPVRLDTRIDFRYRFGFRFWRRCRRYARDSGYAHGSLATNAEGTAAFSLNPSFRRRPDGKYEITIEPHVALMFDLENTNIRLRLRGVSRFTRFWIAIKGFVAGVFRITADIFKGRSLKTIFRGIVRRFVIKLGHVLTLSYFELPSGLRRTIESKLLSPYVQRVAEKRGNRFLDDQEDILNRQFRSVLGIGSSGKRTFVISSDFRIESTGK